jgi:hypothetical protein
VSIRFVTDENVRGDIVRAVRAQRASSDLVRVQDVGLSGADDRAILEWAAREGRVLLAHDVDTMPGFAYARVARGLPMPGVFEVAADAPVGTMLEKPIVLHECSLDDAWEGQVRYLPLT